LARIISRLDQLRDDVEALKCAVEGAVTRHDFQHLAYKVLHTKARVSTAWRELVKMGRDGEQDALVEIVPLTGKGPARDLLFETYRKWAAWHHLKLNVLCEPLTDNEPVFCSIRGDYVYGLLRLEAGHHRVRDKEEHSVVRVRVAPWIERTSEIHFAEQVALKMRGQLGGRVRSRIRIKGVKLMLQNDRILSKNRNMALDVAPSWMVAPEPVENVVRRYDLKPFLVRDYLTDTSTGRADVLMPKNFHELLCQRVDFAAEGAS
jgi:protein subunit release factor A